MSKWETSLAHRTLRVAKSYLFKLHSIGGIILLILGSIPNSADPMVVWFFSFSHSGPKDRDGITNFLTYRGCMGRV